MDQNNLNIPEQLKTLLPELDKRVSVLRKLLVDIESGERQWGVDIDIAVVDVETVLNILQPPSCDEDLCSCENED